MALSSCAAPWEQLGIEFLSVFGLPPVEFVNLAADLGCRYIATGLVGFRLKKLGYPPFSLKDDPALRKEMLPAMDDRGVAISLGDGVLILPSADAHNSAARLPIWLARRPATHSDDGPR